VASGYRYRAVAKFGGCVGIYSQHCFAAVKLEISISISIDGGGCMISPARCLGVGIINKVRTEAVGSWKAGNLRPA